MPRISRAHTANELGASSVAAVVCRPEVPAAFLIRFCLLSQGTGIPEHIINMPSEFLGTELGQSLRPMFEQVSGNLPAIHAHIKVIVPRSHILPSHLSASLLQSTQAMNARLGSAGGQVLGGPVPAAPAAAATPAGATSEQLAAITAMVAGLSGAGPTEAAAAASVASTDDAAAEAAKKEQQQQQQKEEEEEEEEEQEADMITVSVAQVCDRWDCSPWSGIACQHPYMVLHCNAVDQGAMQHAGSIGAVASCD